MKHSNKQILPALLTAGALWLCSAAFSTVSAQDYSGFYVNPSYNYGGNAYSYYGSNPYNNGSSYYGGDMGYNAGSYYGGNMNFSNRHVGQHRGLHVTSDSGLHWGRHVGEHRVNGRRAHNFNNNWY